MTAMISTSHLVLILCLLLSLAARAGVPKALCLAARVLLLLASVENAAAIMDWMIGAAVAWLPVRERIQPCRAVLCRGPLRPGSCPGDSPNKNAAGWCPPRPDCCNSLVQALRAPCLRSLEESLAGDPSEVTALGVRHWITSFRC